MGAGPGGGGGGGGPDEVDAKARCDNFLATSLAGSPSAFHVIPEGKFCLVYSARRRKIV